MSIFSEVKAPKVPRSKFSLSHEVKLSCNFGDLVPVLCQEVLPGDSFRINTEALLKFAPLKAPVMHRVKYKIDYFYVPLYQVCRDFENFINEKVNTEENPVSLPWVTPKQICDNSKPGETATITNMVSTLADYFHLPVTQPGFLTNNTKHISPLPFLAYQHIYNSYFRDQNLNDISKGAAAAAGDCFDVETYAMPGAFPDLSVLTSAEKANLFQLRKSSWAKDYFTSALPSPQAGDEVTLPSLAAESIPVTTAGDGALTFEPVDSEFPEEGDYSDLALAFEDSETASTVYDKGGDYEGVKPSNLEVDLSDLKGLSINNLRKLFQLQKFKELSERGGTRYSEMVRNFFGVFLPDMYTGRPVYLGGQVQRINVGEVVQTSETDTTQQGYRAGIAGAYGRTRNVRLHARMHGYLFGILRVLPEATYQQGLERMWTRESLYDYAFPQFANLGEQEILNQEIYYSGVDKDDAGVFGYTPRYAEYKDSHCHVAGKFRSDLAYWHFGRIFGSAPTLSKEFVNMGTMNYTPFYITDAGTEHVYVDIYHHIKSRRPLPYFGTPGGI